MERLLPSKLACLLPSAHARQQFTLGLKQKSNHPILLNDGSKSLISKNDLKNMCDYYYPTKSENLRVGILKEDSLDFITCYDGKFEETNKFITPLDPKYSGLKLCKKSIAESLKIQNTFSFCDNGSINLNIESKSLWDKKVFKIHSNSEKVHQSSEYRLYEDPSVIIKPRSLDPSSYFVRIFIDNYKKEISAESKFFLLLKELFQLGKNLDESYHFEKFLVQEDPDYLQAITHGFTKDCFYEYSGDTNRFLHLGIFSIFKARYIAKSLATQTSQKFKFKFLPICTKYNEESLYLDGALASNIRLIYDDPFGDEKCIVQG